MLILYLNLNILLITARRGKFANLNFTEYHHDNYWTLRRGGADRLRPGGERRTRSLSPQWTNWGER